MNPYVSLVLAIACFIAAFVTFWPLISRARKSKNWADLTRLPVSKGEEAKSHRRRIVLKAEKPEYQPPKVAPPSRILGQFAGRGKISQPTPHITPHQPRASNAIFQRGGLVSRHSMGKGTRLVTKGRQRRGMIL